MSNEANKPNKWFWIIGVIALIWNGMGANAYLMQAFMTAEELAALPEAERALYTDYPTWATTAFAIAVWGGVLASILLLLRKSLAYIVFIISLIGIVVQMIHSLFIGKSMEVYGPGAVIMPIMVMLIGFGLVYYAKKCQTNGWLS